MNTETQTPKHEQEITWPKVVDDGLLALVIIAIAFFMFR